METQQPVSSSKLQSPIALLESAINLYKQRFATFFVILLIPLLVQVASWLFPFLFKASGIIPFTSVIFSIVSIFVSILGGLALLYAIKDNTGVEVSYKKGWTKIFSYFWLRKYWRNESAFKKQRICKRQMVWCLFKTNCCFYF